MTKLTRAEIELEYSSKSASEIEFRKKIRKNVIFDARRIRTYAQLVHTMNKAFSKHPKQPTQKQLNIASDELNIKPTRNIRKAPNGKYKEVK